MSYFIYINQPNIKMMKNYFLAITFITLIILSCSKSEDDSPSTQVTDTTLYEGTWRGNLIPTSSGAVPTTWVMNVTGDGQVNQTHENTHGPGTGIGTITEDGILSLTYDGGGTETGTFDAQSGTYSGNATHGSLTADSFGIKD